MTKKVTVGDQEVYVLPKPTGAVLWWGDRRVELTHHELNALADAFANVAAPQLAVVA